MRYRLLLAPLGLCAFAGLSVGCRSVVSTHVTPNPLEGGWKTEKVRGLPVTVMVPTHLEVRVVERRFYQPGGDFDHIATTRIVAEKVHEKAQLFMVDAARPAAGDLGMSATFGNEKNPQFFSAYDAKADDKTIATITKLVPSLPDVLSNLKKARAIAEPSQVTPADASLAMAFTDHIVAVRVFDLADPALTDAVKQFMAEYVNCQQVCPAACPAVVK